MKIIVTDPAVECFQKDWDYRAGDYIRVYVRYSGGGEDAFAFGISKDEPRYPAISNVHGGITFFIEENDLWYLDDRDLIIDCLHEDIVILRG